MRWYAAVAWLMHADFGDDLDRGMTSGKLPRSRRLR
jgi:hypothetical protein